MVAGREATFGVIHIDCPTCGRPLDVPIHAAGPTWMGRTTLRADGDYIAAHALTHGTHDGEPLPLAA